MHDQRREHDQIPTYDLQHPRKTRSLLSTLPLIATLALLPMTVGAQAIGVKTSTDKAPWVPDECCELAAAGAVHNSYSLFERTLLGHWNLAPTPDKENKEPSATASVTAESEFSTRPAVAMMLVGMGGFIARSRRLR